MSRECLSGVSCDVLKRVVVGAVVLIGSLIPLEMTSAAAPDIAGTRCSAAGVVRVVRRVSYTCSATGKRLVWRRGATTTTTTTSSTTTTTTTSSTTTTIARRTAAQVVAEKIETFVEPMRKRSQPVPVIEYRFGPSVGEEDRAMTRQVAEAFFKFGSFPRLASYRNAITVSLSDAEAIETTAPLHDISQYGSIAGGYTGTGTYALVLQNFTSHRCGRGATAASCAASGSGGSLGRFRVRVNILHEFSHGGKVELMGYDPTQSNSHLDRMPMWFASGISNVQGAMILAVLDGVPYNNPNINASDARRCIDASISKVSREDFQPAGGGGCRGVGTGDFANEVLVARFGLEKVLEFVAGSRDRSLRTVWPDWSSSWSTLFEQLFLQSPASFERDVETYRLAVLNNTDLPTDFLDAKARS